MTGDLTNSNVRVAGLSLGLVLTAIGGLKLGQHRPSGPFLLAVGGLVMLAALLFPRVLKPPVSVAAFIGEKVVWALSRLALLVVFYAIVTPIAVIGRLLGARFCDTAFAEKKPSYWYRKDGRPANAEEYEKQY